jgi:hypothetical protein
VRAVVIRGSKSHDCEGSSGGRFAVFGFNRGAGESGRMKKMGLVLPRGSKGRAHKDRCSMASLSNERAIVIQPDTPGTARLILPGSALFSAPHQKRDTRTCPRRQGAGMGVPRPNSAHRDEARAAKCRVTAPVERHSHVRPWRPDWLAGAGDGVSGLVAAVSGPLGGCASD